MGAELASLYDGVGVWNHKCAEFVYAYVLYVDVRHEGVQYDAFGVAHVALQFAEQCDGGCGWRVFEHVLLPVFAEVVFAFWYFGGKVMVYYGGLLRVGNHAEYPCAVVVYGFIEFAPLSVARIQHYVCRGFEVLLVYYVAHVAVLAVGIGYDVLLQFVCVVVQRVAHGAYLACLVEPLLYLYGVGFHLFVEIAVDGGVFRGGACCCTVYAFVYERESVEHIARHVEREHSEQNDVHQVDHLLSWRNRFSFNPHYCRNFL